MPQKPLPGFSVGIVLPATLSNLYHLSSLMKLRSHKLVSAVLLNFALRRTSLIVVYSISSHVCP